MKQQNYERSRNKFPVLNTMAKIIKETSLTLSTTDC